MSPTTHSSHIPRLRFPGFFGNWEEKKLGEISERIIKKNKEYNENVLTISGQLWLISQIEFFNKSVAWSDLSWYYLLGKWDFAYNKSYSNWYPMWAIKKLNRYEKWVVSTLYICFRTDNKLVNKNLLEQYFESWNHNREIEKIAQEWARNHGLLNIAIWDFFQTKLNLPSLPEQTKIADFLTVVDEKIQSLTDLRTVWEEYKTGVMQQIFSQSIRFPGFVDEWEEKKLGGIWDTYNWLLWKTAEDFGEWDKYITYKQIFDNSKIDLSKSWLVNINEKQNKVKFGDIFFTISSETPKEIWYSSVFLDDVDYNVYLNSFCFWYRIKNQSIFSPIYARRLFRSSSWRKQIIKLAQWSTRYNMSKNEFIKLKIKLPSLPEQEKIANFLTSIDDKITELNIQIQTAKQWKTGVLQGLFI